MRLVVTGGGTAGHVYPALTVVDWLRAELGDALDTLYLGSVEGMEAEIARRHGYRYVGVPAGQVRGRNPFGAVAGLGVSAAGIGKAIRVFREYQPDAVLATGGYASFPGVLAAWLRRIGSLVYLPDVAPGWAVRAVGRLATVIATTTDCARRSLPGARIAVTGYPVRASFHPDDAAESRRRLGLAEDRFTVVIVGGSRGARRINDAVLDGLDRLLAIGQLLHLTGQLDYDRVVRRRDALDHEARVRYRVEAYLEQEMSLALAAADLIVSRAGASTLGEYPAVGRASLLIPGPFSGQLLNARYLVDQGAARLLPNDDAGRLADEVVALANRPEELRSLAAGAARLARPNAAADIGKLVLDIARRSR